MFEIPFNSSFKWQLTIHSMASTGGFDIDNPDEDEDGDSDDGGDI